MTRPLAFAGLAMLLVSVAAPAGAQAEFSDQPAAVAVVAAPTLTYVTAGGSTIHSRVYGGAVEVSSRRFGLGLSLGRYDDDTGLESVWAVSGTAYFGEGRTGQTVPALSLSIGGVRPDSRDAVTLFSPMISLARRLRASPEVEVVPQMAFGGVFPVSSQNSGTDPQIVVSAGLGLGMGTGSVKFIAMPTASYASSNGGERGVSVGAMLGIVTGFGQ